MEKYVNNIKDLVIQALTNGSEIKRKAGNGDALSCFQMGMIYLLGINTPIDFKKATIYLENNSLKEDPDANRLLAFIAECDGNYSLSFEYYSKANGKVDSESYYDIIYKERESLRHFFKLIGLPQRVLNNVITKILEEYKKGESHRFNASIELAVICKDKRAFTEVAKCYSDAGDYGTAIAWLCKADVKTNHPLYLTSSKKIQESSIALKESRNVQLLEIEDNSLLSDFDISTTFAETTKAFAEIPSLCCGLWRKAVTKKISKIKNQWKDEEQKRKKAEKKERLEAEAAENARRRKKKQIIKHSIIIILLFIFGASDYKELGASNGFIGGVIFVLCCYSWFYFIRWIWRGIKNRNKKS